MDLQVLLNAESSIIVIQGSAAQVQADLGLTLKEYSNGTVNYYSAMGTPLISGVNMYCSNVSALVYAHPPNIVTQHNFESALNLDNKTKPQQSSFAISGYSPIDLQAVYGVQSLIASGINGSGYNIGLLDFDGNPGVQEELSLFDNYVVGIPDPPNFQIVPIGNYNPNLGIVSGWAGEIDMDVESAHSMAPGANITLYIADSSLPLVAPLATIVQDHQVNDLSQSFSSPESFNSGSNSTWFMFNVILPDQQYRIGITYGYQFFSIHRRCGCIWI